MIKLNPCAKCGGKAIRTHDYNQWYRFYTHYVACSRCGNTTEKTAQIETSRKTADAAWNAANPKEGTPNEPSA